MRCAVCQPVCPRKHPSARRCFYEAAMLARADMRSCARDHNHAGYQRHFQRHLQRPPAPGQHSPTEYNANSLVGQYHQGYLGGSTWLYRNPFTAPRGAPAEARLTDDEIANAVLLRKMAAYARGGDPFYSVADASQDRYLDLLIAEAADTGTTVTATPMPWAGHVSPPNPPPPP